MSVESLIRRPGSTFVGGGVHDVGGVHHHIAGLVVGHQPPRVVLFGEPG